MNRRKFTFLVGMGLAGMGSVITRAASQSDERVIKISAKKFEFNPATIQLRKDVPVTLEFTTEDVVMGFSAPDFGVRTTIVPGKVAQLRLQPDKTGDFAFHCDVFCGSGHEDMTGTITVVA